MDLEKIKEFIKKNIKQNGIELNSLCEKLEIKDYELLGIIELLKQDGFSIDVIGDKLYKVKKERSLDDTYEIPNKLNHLKLLLISDTHLANKCDDLGLLKYLYSKADDLGIKTVLHGGDILDGNYANRPQQLLELRKYGFDDHLKYVVDKYPKFNGETLFIGGNHLDSYIKSGGGDMGKAISKERKDLIYLDPSTANIKIGKIGIVMHHGSGGSAYSRTYKLQRYVETLPLDKKIDIVMMGHHHTSGYLNYLGKHCFQIGCLCDESPFVRSMGLNHEKSCWWLDIDLDDKGNIYEITPKLEVFPEKTKYKSIKMNNKKI